MLMVLAAAGGSLLVARIAAFRATVPARVIGFSILGGVLLGATALPLLDRATDPYSQAGASGPLSTLALGLTRTAALAAPALFVLRGERRRLTSLSDAYLVAFATGFGADLAAYVMLAVNPQPNLTGLAMVPPLQWHAKQANLGHEIWSAGFGAWAALVVLAAAAGRRLGGRLAAALAGGLAGLIAALDMSYVQTQIGPAAWPARVLADLTLDGRLMAWVPLLAVVVLGVVEARWVITRTDPAWRHHALSRTAAGPAGSVGRQFRAMRERIRRGIVLAEYARDPAGEEAARSLQSAGIEAPPDRADAPAAAVLPAWAPPTSAPVVTLAPPTPVVAVMTRMRTMLGPRWRVLGPPLVAAGAAFVVLVAFPRWPSGAGTWFWNRPPTGYDLFGLPLSLLDVALLIVVGGWAVRAGIRSRLPIGADVLLDGDARTAVLRTAMAVLALAVTYYRSGILDPWRNAATDFSTHARPELTARQLTTVILLVTVAAAGSAAVRGAAWRAFPFADRRQVVVQNTAQLVAGTVVTALSIRMFNALIQRVHTRYGAGLYDNFGSSVHGNTAGAVFTAMAVAVASVLLSLGLRLVTRRIVAYLTAATAS